MNKRVGGSVSPSSCSRHQTGSSPSADAASFSCSPSQLSGKPTSDGCTSFRHGCMWPRSHWPCAEIVGYASSDSPPPVYGTTRIWWLPPSSSTDWSNFRCGAYRTSCTLRPSHRGAGMVLEFVHRGGLLVGVSPAAEEIVRRLRQIRSDICAHHGILRAGHGHFPAALSGSFPPDVAPALALLTALSAADRLPISLLWQGERCKIPVIRGFSARAGRSLRGVSCGANYLRTTGEGFADPRRRTL